MKLILYILTGCIFLVISNLAAAAATPQTATAAKAKAAESAAQENADKANADVDTAIEEANKAAAAAAKAAEVAKAAVAAKKAKAEAAVKQAKEKAEAAKKAIVAAAKVGAKSCDDWKQERASKSSTGSAVTWLSGFLAGIEISKNQDFLNGTNSQTMYSSIDVYCEAHPFEFVSDAGISLYFELARKKGLIP